MVLGVWALAGPLRAEGPRWLHKNAKATLDVKSKSEGALVTIDHQAVGVLPHAPFELDAGVHLVGLSMEGMKPEERRVSLKGGEQGHITIQLRPLPKPAEAPPLITLNDASPGAQAADSTGQAPAPSDEVPLVIVGGELANPAAAGAGEAARAGSPDVEAKAEGEAAKSSEADAKSEKVSETSERKSSETSEQKSSETSEQKSSETSQKSSDTSGAHAARPPAPADALSTEAAPEATPLTHQWWFWGGMGAAAVVVTAVIVAALPATYSESRNPSTACNGPCTVVVNK